jgi:hypothetical protein
VNIGKGHRALASTGIEGAMTDEVEDVAGFAGQ